MFALIVMAAVAPSFLCFAASAYMAVNDKAAWKYFAGSRSLPVTAESTC